MMPKSSTPRGQRWQGAFLLSFLLCLLASPPLVIAADNPPQDIVIAVEYGPYRMIYVIVPQGSLNPEQKSIYWWPAKDIFKPKEKEKSKDETPKEIDKT